MLHRSSPLFDIVPISRPRLGRYRILSTDLPRRRAGRGSPRSSCPETTPGVFAHFGDQPSRLGFTAYFGPGRARTPDDDGRARAFPSRIEVFTPRELIIRGTAAGARISGYNLAGRAVSAARGRLNFAPTCAIAANESGNNFALALRARGVRGRGRMNERRCCSSATAR